jgi:hypothetical protein
MKRIFDISPIFFIVLIFNCAQGPSGPAGPAGLTDKQIRLEFAFGSLLTIGTTDTVPLMIAGGRELIKFDKNNYEGVDSIILVARVQIDSQNHYCNVDLYDLTDSMPIQNSLIQSNNTASTIAESKNIYRTLPDKEISLCTRIWSSKVNANARITQAWLFLYRK